MTLYVRASAEKSLAARISRLETDASIARRRGEWGRALELERRGLALERDLHERMKPNLPRPS